MSERRYVQHVGGSGIKWCVFKEHGFSWEVYGGGAGPLNEDHYSLPKSEYLRCDPPEPKWVDVTRDCVIPTFYSREHKDYCEVWHASNRLFIVGHELVQGYRLRKVQIHGATGVTTDLHAGDRTELRIPKWAFIVEKRQP